MFHVEQSRLSMMYDVVVIGGGHAGIEAASAAAPGDADALQSLLHGSDTWAVG